MRRRLQVLFGSLIILLVTFERCSYDDINVNFNCDQSTLAIELQSKTDVTNCRSIDGAITVLATGGIEPYDFNINGGDYQTNNSFSNLGAGTYTIRVKDKNSCWKAIEVSISASGSTLAATVETTPDNQCGAGNGTAVVTATGGVPPYEFQINSQGYNEGNTFENLSEGQHVIVVKDSEECQTTLSVTIKHGNTGVSYNNEIKRIIETNCAFSGCHDAGSGSRNWTDYEKLKDNAQNVKLRTGNRTMPPDDPLSAEDIERIACWVDDGALNN